MRVVILSDRVPPDHAGGAELVAWRLAVRLGEGGHGVRVITATAGPPLEERRDGVEVHALHCRYPERLQSWLSLANPAVTTPLRRLYERLQPDVVHAHNVHHDLTWASLAIASRLGIPTVFTAHDLMSLACGKVDGRLLQSRREGSERRISRLPRGYDLRRMRLRYNPWRNAVIRRILRRHARVRTCVSEAQRLVLETHGLPGFEVLPNGVDVPRFAVDPATVEASRRGLDLAGRRVVLFAGRVGIEKGGRQLAAALQRVAERLPAVHLLVLARSSPGVESFTSGVLDPSRVCFGGWREGPALAAAYALSDLVAVPSLCFEAGSLVALEAMAAGRPVIGTVFGGPAEYVADGETGLLVDPNDLDAFTVALERLLLEDGLRERLGAAGPKRVEQCYSLSLHVARTLEAYARAIAMPRGPVAG